MRTRRMVSRRTFARLALASTVLAVVAGSTAQAGPGDDPVSGIVFRDFDADGTRDPREPGEGGITVRAVDRADAEVSTTTSADGTYSLGVTALDAGPYRIEFDIPSDATWLAEGTHGPVSATSVQFAPAGGVANFAVSNPNDYCQANPRLVTSCFTGGDPLGGNAATANRAALKSFPYTATGQGNPAVVDEATSAQIGATWGIATDRATGDVFVASLVKRHAGLGPGGVDAIYREPAGGGAPTVWFDDVRTDDGSVTSNSARGLAAAGTPSHDAAVFPLVGTRGWGDIDMAEDANSVFAVNLFDRLVYEIDRSGSSAVALPMPNYPTCANGVARPWGLGIHDGEVFLGVVCSAESGGTRTDLTAQVLRFDIASSTWGAPAFATAVSLNYARGCTTTWFGVPQGCNWNPWTNIWDKPTFAPFGATATGSDQQRRVSYPVPLLSDIEVDDDGSLILAFMDRTGHMFGIDNYPPDPSSTALFTADLGGDLLRAAPPASSGGVYTLELGGSAGVGAGLGGGTISSGAGNNQGPGGGEFYRNDSFGSAHQETSEGAVALIKGRGEVASTQMDPFAAHSAGVSRFSNTNGSTLGEIELLANSRNPIGFGKANAIGDLEVLCELAPIEIGNRVWIDSDDDGIQDPDEAALAGVTVELRLDLDGDGVPDGPAIATAVTAVDGTYYFSSATGASTASARYGITQLVTGARVIVAVPTSASLDGSTTGVLTINDVGGSDRIDSDAMPTTGFSSTTTLAGPGRNDHSLDFGYVEPYSLGNKVWSDVDNDGVFDDTEVGLGNVTVRLYRPGGTVELATTVTDSDGSYVFVDLRAGEYEVAIVPPASYRSSTGINGSVSGPYEGAATPDPDTDVDLDDNGTTQLDGTIRSAPVTLGAAAEPTDEADDDVLADSTTDRRSNKSVDFGLFIPASIGDYVWLDTNRDGVQNEPVANGINGVTVELYAPGVDDVAGTSDDVLVASTGTADDGIGNPGYYRFDDLVPGRYFIAVPTLPAGTTLTVADAGSADSADSDPDPATRRTIITTLDPGEHDPTWDIGIYTPTVNLGDQVWLDSNNDGRIDPGEPGVADVVVNLLSADGSTQLATSTTNATGHYRFSGLVPGDYLVEVVPPAGLRSSTGVPGSRNGPFEGASTPDPDGDVDDDDNGTTQPDGRIRSALVTVSVGTEPIDDDDTGTPAGGADERDRDGNTTVDFGLIFNAQSEPPPTTTTTPTTTTPTTTPPNTTPPNTTMPTGTTELAAAVTVASTAPTTSTSQLPGTGSSGIVTLVLMGLGCIVAGFAARRLRRV